MTFQPHPLLPYFDGVCEYLRQTPAASPWINLLPQQIAQGLSPQRYGDLPQWLTALTSMPLVSPDIIDLTSSVTIGKRQAITEADYQQLLSCLQQLIPWRKGPFSLFGIDIDTEWRSDWKWQRLLPHIQPLQGRHILDVGCGNGYHCLRMYGEGAKRVIGIDPSPRFVVQFLMLKKLLGDIPVDVLPVAIEQVPQPLTLFDTTFSMGVLYHRRAPLEHLMELKSTLKAGGELVLETLIIEGEEGDQLIPDDRYAMMRNVWSVPSAATVIYWLKQCGFQNPTLVDCSITTQEEQRSTEWMRFQSLADFLNPEDNTKTIEGYPAPMRGIFTATKV